MISGHTLARFGVDRFIRFRGFCERTHMHKIFVLRVRYFLSLNTNVVLLVTVLKFASVVKSTNCSRFHISFYNLLQVSESCNSSRTAIFWGHYFERALTNWTFYKCRCCKKVRKILLFSSFRPAFGSSAFILLSNELKEIGDHLHRDVLYCRAFFCGNVNFTFPADCMCNKIVCCRIKYAY
jgi:hypothetical protein